MADVSIDAAADTETARVRRSVVAVSEDNLYCFFIDANNQFAYRKSTDGGASWGAAVNIGAVSATFAADVWFDQWTPGDSGVIIHIWFLDTAADDVRYVQLDTSSDTLGTIRTVAALSSLAAGRGIFVSGTKTRSGYLYCAYDLDAGAEKGLHRSTDGGTTWSASLSATFVEATLDECLLFPASNTGDDNDCWAVYLDTSALALTLKMWDSSAAAAVESATILAFTPNATDLTGQCGYSGSIRHSDGHLILVAVSERDTATADHCVFDIGGTGSITTKTSITTNIDDHYYPAVFIDQNTDDIYVAYNGKRDGSETLSTATKVYYAKSTDDGGTWSAGDTAYMEGAAAAVFQVWAPLMGPRFYVGWRVGTTLVGNAVNSVTFSTVIELVVADVGVALGAEAPALTQANTLVAQDAAVSLGAEAPTLQIPATELAVADASVALSVENPALVQANVLALQDALVALTVDSPALVQANVLAPNDARVLLAIDNVALVQAHVLAIADALIAASAESPALTQANILVPQDSTIAFVAESPTLSLSTLLELLDVAIALAIESPALTQQNVLAPADSTVALSAESPSLDFEAMLDIAEVRIALGIESPILIMPEGPTVYLVVGKAVDLSSTMEAVNIISRIMALDLASTLEAVEVSGRGALRATDVPSVVETVEIVAGV